MTTDSGATVGAVPIAAAVPADATVAAPAIINSATRRRIDVFMQTMINRGTTRR